VSRKAHDGGERSGWRLTPGGVILLIALLVLIILAIVAPSTPVYAALALVILLWAAALNSSFPTQTIGRSAPMAREFADQLRDSDTGQPRRR